MEKLEILRREDTDYMEPDELESQILKYIDVLRHAGVDYADAVVIITNTKNIGMSLCEYYRHEENEREIMRMLRGYSKE